MRLLLDTNILLKIAGIGPPLPPDYIDLIRTADLAVSVVSRIEIAIKVGGGKLLLHEEGRPVTDEFFWNESIRRLQAEVLPILSSHVEPLSTLEPLHRDPFDRLLICQSQVTGYPLVTTDPLFRTYDVQVFDPRLQKSVDPFESSGSQTTDS